MKKRNDAICAGLFGAVLMLTVLLFVFMFVDFFVMADAIHTLFVIMVVLDGILLAIWTRAEWLRGDLFGK